MSTATRYAIPVTDSQWPVPGRFDTVFRWEYDDGRDALLALYQQGKLAPMLAKLNIKIL